MKPEQFIREFGVEKAREVVEGAPDKTASHYAQGKWGDAYYSLEFVSVWSNEEKDWFDSDYAIEEELNRDYMVVVDLSNLKRLVESVDRVNAFGGLKDAKAVVKMGKHYKYLKAHIGNYESIYGGGDE